MNSYPLSIITVCRNEASGIRRTAESIVSQKLQDFEWIVIDGASTDETVDILQDYRTRINHFVSEPDGGIYDAMNKGARMASGEYLIFLNGGDNFYNTEVISACVPHLKYADILHGGCRVVYPDGKLNKSIQYKDEEITPRMLAYRALPHPSVFFRRILFERLGGFRLSFPIIADKEIICRAFLQGTRFRSIPVCISDFTLGGASNTRVDDVNMELCRLRRMHFPGIWIRDTLSDEWHSILLNLKRSLSKRK